MKTQVKPASGILAWDENIRSCILSEMKGEMIGVGQDGKFFSKVKER